MDVIINEPTNVETALTIIVILLFALVLTLYATALLLLYEQAEIRILQGNVD